MSKDVKFLLWVLIACVMAGALMIYSVLPKKPAEMKPSPAVTDKSAEMKPPKLNVSIQPYNLFQNPFLYRGNLVSLNPRIIPRTYHSSIFDFIDGGFINAGLKFRKMLTENEALYDVMTLDVDYRPYLQLVGQILIILPKDPQQMSELGMGPISFEYSWLIEPLGTLEGTNALGAKISVPAIRFWEYNTEERAIFR